jgi:hypothetical protein
MSKEERYTDKEMLQKIKVNQLPDNWTILDIFEAYGEYTLGYAAVVKLDVYNGQNVKSTEMYFKTLEAAEKYLTEKEYKEDDTFGWKKDYFETASIKMVKLHS